MRAQIWSLVARVGQSPSSQCLAGREIAREFLQADATPEALADETLRLVTDATAREQLQRELAAVITHLGDHGAAEAILGELARQC